MDGEMLAPSPLIVLFNDRIIQAGKDHQEQQPLTKHHHTHKIYPEGLQQLPFWTLSGMATPPLHWTASSSACQSLSQENFAHIQPKPSLVKHEAISSCPIKSFLGEEIPPHYNLLPGCVEKMQSNIATRFILVFQPCGHSCSKGLLPTLRGCLGNNWAKLLWPFFWTILSKLTNFPPALKVSCDICWAAVVRLCLGEQTSVSTGARLWKALLRDVIQFGS